LLLVLGDDDRGLGMVEDVDEFGGDRILVNRDRDAAEALGRELRPIKPRPVVADYRQLVAAPKALRGDSSRKVAYLLIIPCPGVSLANAEVLLAQCRALGHRLRIASQHSR